MICFSWVGLTKYSARSIGAFVHSMQERVVVLATHSRMPYKGIEECIGCDVHWVKPGVQVDMRRELGELPRCLFSSAWWAPEFSDSWEVVRANGGRVYGLVDNNYVPTFKCFLNGLRFRVKFARKFDGFLVPGNSGVRLLTSYGVPCERVKKGMYCADSELFHPVVPPSKRPKKILFTGQLIERKNVLRMCSAFLRANEACGNEWTLEICGMGSLQDALPKDDHILIHGFVQPEALAPLYQTARCFVLPSLEEHWGVVVHEAALSGCMLLLSDRVGAVEDFLVDGNGVAFNPYDETAMLRGFRSIMWKSDAEMDSAGEMSACVGKAADQNLFVKSVTEFVEGT